jgi:hypothetical protein
MTAACLGAMSLPILGGLLRRMQVQTMSALAFRWIICAPRHRRPLVELAATAFTMSLEHAPRHAPAARSLQWYFGVAHQTAPKFRLCSGWLPHRFGEAQ